MNPAGNRQEFFICLGGVTDDEGTAITLGRGGNFRIAGITTSSDFPVSSNPCQNVRKGHQDAFIAKFTSAGSQLLYSSDLGGSARQRNRGVMARAIAVENRGAVCVAGGTKQPNFSVERAIQSDFGGKLDAFLTKLRPDQLRPVS